MKKYLLVMMLALARVTLVRADVTYDPWKDLGNHVSARVMGPLLMDGEQAWEFRNDGAQTITYMDFTYTDKTGTHEDQLPGSLKPGATIGGWTAFTFTPIGGGQTVYLTIKAIKRAGDDNASGNATGAGQSDTSSQQAAAQAALQQQPAQLQQQIQQQQAAAQERQQQLQQQLAAKQAQQQAQRTAQETRRQQALDIYNAAVQRNQAIQNSIQNTTDQIIDILQRQQAEKNEREAKEQMEREQAEADREQRDLQNQIGQLQQQAANNQNNNQNFQNNYSPAPVQMVQPQTVSAAPPAPVKPPEPSFDDLLQQASRGDAAAENKLGIVYQNQKHDYTQAADWYLKAAEQGNADAEYNLAVMYRGGWGVAKDLVQAKAWYQKAAAQGNQSAKYALSKLN